MFLLFDLTMMIDSKILLSIIKIVYSLNKLVKSHHQKLISLLLFDVRWSFARELISRHYLKSDLHEELWSHRNSWSLDVVSKFETSFPTPKSSVAGRGTPCGTSEFSCMFIKKKVSDLDNYAHYYPFFYSHFFLKFFIWIL